MGSKKVIGNAMPTGGGGPLKLLNASAMTGTATVTSASQSIANVDNISLQVSWTGTPTGTFIVQTSNDGTNFFTTTFNPALAQPAGSASGYMINLVQMAAPFMRVSYTNASGTGALTVSLFAKDLN